MKDLNRRQQCVTTFEQQTRCKRLKVSLSTWTSDSQTRPLNFSSLSPACRHLPHQTIASHEAPAHPSPLVRPHEFKNDQRSDQTPILTELRSRASRHHRKLMGTRTTRTKASNDGLRGSSSKRLSMLRRRTRPLHPLIPLIFALESLPGLQGLPGRKTVAVVVRGDRLRSHAMSLGLKARGRVYVIDDIAWVTSETSA